MNSRKASTRGTKITVGVVVALALVIVFVLIRLTGDDDEPTSAAGSPSATDATVPDEEPSQSASPSPEPAPAGGVKLKPSQKKTIEIPNAPPVKPTLSTNCGDAYSTVYFRTTTKSAEQTICADSPGGTYLALVSKSAKDGTVTVLKAGYAHMDDSYVAVKGNTTWVIGAGTGDVSVFKNDRLVRTEKSTYTWEIPEPPEDA